MLPGYSFWRPGGDRAKMTQAKACGYVDRRAGTPATTIFPKCRELTGLGFGFFGLRFCLLGLRFLHLGQNFLGQFRHLPKESLKKAASSQAMEGDLRRL